MSFPRENRDNWPALGYTSDGTPPTQQQQQLGSYTVQTTQRVEYFPNNLTHTEVHHYTTVSTSYGGVFPQTPAPSALSPVNFSLPPPRVDKIDYSQPPPFPQGPPSIQMPPINVPNFPPPIAAISGQSRVSENGTDLQLGGYKVSAKRADKIAELLLSNDTYSSSRSPPRRYRRSRSRFVIFK